MIRVTVANISLSNMGFVMLLKSQSDDRCLPIFVGVPEAQVLSMALGQAPGTRPMAHDLLKNMMDLLECRLESVGVTEVRDGVFHGCLTLYLEGRRAMVDARPSDAIALALRCHAPVFVADEVMDLAAVQLNLPAGNTEAEGHASAAEAAVGTLGRLLTAAPPPQRHGLGDELADAIREERYEDAARIRDQLRQARAA